MFYSFISLLISLSGETPLPDVRPFIGPYDTSCFSERVVNQKFFEGVTFVELDTGPCSSVSLLPADYRGPLRLAIDRAGRAYKLFNFDSTQFDDLVSAHPVKISLDSVSEYGKLYIEMTMNLHGHEYFSSADQLISLNKEGRTASMFFEKKESEHTLQRACERIENRITTLCRGFNFDRIVYDKTHSEYVLDYYIWYLLTGDVRHINLAVSRTGSCRVLHDSIVATKIGYYEPGQK